MSSSKVAKMTLGIHPFPARMAPSIALNRLKTLPRGSSIADPMGGSGTVAYQAVTLGHNAISFDLDPLAVLVAKVTTRKQQPQSLPNAARQIVAEARRVSPSEICLPWIDDDPETCDFVRYWFGRKQSNALRRLAFVLFSDEFRWHRSDIVAHLQVAMSRIIVTKQWGASLAWDVSHSRPHRVYDTTDFDVLTEFLRSAGRLHDRLAERKPILGKSLVYRGDARRMNRIDAEQVDAIVTSPPYLNAIDYLRGHRLSLVWMGYKVGELRSLRSQSIGNDRALTIRDGSVDNVLDRFGDIDQLPPRMQGTVRRYALDLLLLTQEMHRVLRPGGRCWVVIGDNCLKNVFLSNSKAFICAAKAAGFSYLRSVTRPIPAQHRYLPLPVGSQLSNRMSEETVLSFRK